MYQILGKCITKPADLGHVHVFVVPFAHVKGPFLSSWFVVRGEERVGELAAVVPRWDALALTVCLSEGIPCN